MLAWLKKQESMKAGRMWRAIRNTVCFLFLLYRVLPKLIKRRFDILSDLDPKQVY